MAREKTRAKILRQKGQKAKDKGKNATAKGQKLENPINFQYRNMV